MNENLAVLYRDSQRELRDEVEAAHRYLDECYINDADDPQRNGTASLVERIGQLQAQAHAENERLRLALKGIVALLNHPDNPWSIPDSLRIAKTALNEEAT